LRSVRRSTLRFREETKAIGGWLGLVRTLAAEDYDLAVEVAECPQLVKGYGETHSRGVAKFEAATAAIPTLRRTENPAAAMKKLREAALADENGEKLAAELRKLPA
jgi:indolepyruvate ferredoxin oxidoreductase beta subunit